LDAGNLSVERIYKPGDYAERPEKIENKGVGQVSDKPDQDKEHMIFYLLHNGGE